MFPRGPRPRRQPDSGSSCCSAVDHALVLGVPVLDPQRGPVLRPGLGRPLVATNLERDEAIRLLAVGRRDTTRLVAALFGVGLVAIVAGLAWWVVDAVR